jgi:hypothetical protein
LNGLVEGDGRLVFGIRVCGTVSPVEAAPGENREGTVPARARRTDTCVNSSVGSGPKSGKPSVGDSGIFSRRGVEFPLVGGPQRLGVSPS